MSVSGRSAITTAAAWIEELRTIPSSPFATSMIWRASGSLSYTRRSSGSSARYCVEALRAAHHRLGDQLRDPVPRPVVEAEHARRVARGGAREHAAEGHDLGDRAAPVLVGDVLDHALAALDREVDVDVRHRDPLGVQEALEQQVVLERVDVRDAQAVRHDRAGRRAATRADRDAVVLRELDEVPDDQEVGREAHPLDHAELHLEPLDRLGRRRVPVALAQALVREAPQVALLGLAVGRGEARDQHLPELDLDAAALGDLERAGERLRPLGEVGRHLVGVLEDRTRWCRRTASAPAACSSSARTGAPCGCRSPRGAGSGRRPWPRAGGRARSPRLHDPLVGLVLGGDAVLLDLEVDVVGPEDLHQLVRVGARLARDAVDDPPAEARLEAARERDHALRVALEQLQVDVRLAAPVALEIARRAQLDEVAKALVAGREQGEVVALVAHLLRAPVVDEVGLEAEDRLDPVLPAGLVVLDRAVHHPVVGEPERRLAERRRALRQRVDPAGAVEHRVLGMDVEMREAHPGSEYTVGGRRLRDLPLVAENAAERRMAASGCDVRARLRVADQPRVYVPDRPARAPIPLAAPRRRAAAVPEACFAQAATLHRLASPRHGGFSPRRMPRARPDGSARGGRS